MYAKAVRKNLIVRISTIILAFPLATAPSYGIGFDTNGNVWMPQKGAP